MEFPPLFSRSRESMQAYRESDLAATIPQAYGVKGEPRVEVLEVMYPLRPMD